MIKFNGEPILGKNFEFTIQRHRDGNRFSKHTIIAKLNNRIVYKKTFECPDPPCYDVIPLDRKFGPGRLEISYSNTGADISESFTFLVRSDFLYS
ncbi:hypothetical protein AB3N61_18605 [Leptospira sp. WS58.C1]|uniref:hypothetical protein n=1 Tax=Leptospira cinconiae TaxID=3235173 RepID=UPI00349E509C